ncbi:MAG TPA: GlsB/YeaQ/YmgE family stress response membrane protein [Devosia sp.]|jgi:uncharacterized membrane protein YeaQ/YmgE (transglycosylase-associated protein family)|nr:GlsB/YeaQ/YmgE family stress response membrane protein [Devosia sp.]
MSLEGLLIILLVGLVAGWLASLIVRGGGMGIFGDLLVGLVGALIGSWLVPRLHIALGSGLLAEILDATIGAVILLLILRLIFGLGGGRWRRRF